jgi:hypothetical protein
MSNLSAATVTLTIALKRVGALASKLNRAQHRKAPASLLIPQVE